MWIFAALKLLLPHRRVGLHVGHGGVLACLLFLPVSTVGQDRVGSFVIVSGATLAEKWCRGYLEMQDGPKSRSLSMQFVGDVSDANSCSAYVNAILENDSFQSEPPPYCLPKNFEPNTVTESVARYARGHPEERHLAAIVLVRRALRSAYPCRR